MPFKICGKVWRGYGVGSMQGNIFHIEKTQRKISDVYKIQGIMK